MKLLAQCFTHSRCQIELCIKKQKWWNENPANVFGFPHVYTLKIYSLTLSVVYFFFLCYFGGGGSFYRVNLYASYSLKEILLLLGTGWFQGMS